MKDKILNFWLPSMLVSGISTALIAFCYGLLNTHNNIGTVVLKSLNIGAMIALSVMLLWLLLEFVYRETILETEKFEYGMPLGFLIRKVEEKHAQ